MDLFELALSKEKKSEDTYRKLARGCGDQGLEKIFTRLAEDEVKHYNIVKQIKDKNQEIEDTTILKDAKAVFEEMNKRKDQLKCDTSYEDIYEQAQKFEKESEELYEEMSDKTEDHQKKEVFKKLASQEKKHFILMQKMLEFMRRPKEWLEDAEWHHLEEY